MIGTNHDLAQLREAIDFELLRLTALRKMRLGPTGTEDIALAMARLQRERIALCAALVNRRAEAARRVVSFTRWASGNGALETLVSCRHRRFASGGCAAPVPLIIEANTGKGGAR